MGEACVLCGGDDRDLKSDHLRTVYHYGDGRFDPGLFVPRALDSHELWLMQQRGEMTLCGNRRACRRRLVNKEGR